MSTTQAAIEIGPIVFGLDQFQVSGRRIAYADVAHLSWFWHSQTINLVNIQDARLSIHVRGETKPIKVTKHTMWVAPKLAEAYQMLRERTWETRLVLYLEQLEEGGFFRYQDSEFYTDGNIRNGGDVFDLRKATEEPFKLTVKLAGFFSRKLSIELSLDHDIVHTFIARFIREPEDPTRYIAKAQARREQQEAQRHWFFDLIRLCAKMAAVDGRIDPDEILVVKEFVQAAFKLEEDFLRRAIALFNEARESSLPAAFYAKRLATFHGQDAKLISAVMNLLRDVALSDGEMDEDELDLLAEIAHVLGYDPRKQSSRSSGGAENSESKARLNMPSDEVRHGHILELTGKVTIDGIRAAYRKLVLKHHPDKHHHASPSAQRVVHDRMVEINAAYAYFRARYDF